eukprot:TRINITY_DN10701_c0_g1_i2.p1 TRINITY_DN10701_c0_g1~~TRINITY_DN10701_c0_g1_i2.p1  ORF type:complete len:841 (+),score=241.97 TRINITY_DN10701_c0_g1_i2:78-2600(+)
MIVDMSHVALPTFPSAFSSGSSASALPARRATTQHLRSPAKQMLGSHPGKRVRIRSGGPPVRPIILSKVVGQGFQQLPGKQRFASLPQKTQQSSRLSRRSQQPRTMALGATGLARSLRRGTKRQAEPSLPFDARLKQPRLGFEASAADARAMAAEKRQFLAEAAVAQLAASGASGDCFMEGGQLLQALCENPLTTRLAREAKEAFGGKGWLRSLLSSSPSVECLRKCGGKDDYCYRLRTGPSRIPLVSRSSLVAVADGAPSAGRVGDASSSPQLDAAKRSLLQRTEEVLASSSERYLTGAFLSKSLTGDMKSAVFSVREALGGKGWLKKLLAASEVVQRVAITGRDEPCYALKTAPMLPGGAAAAAAAALEDVEQSSEHSSLEEAGQPGALEEGEAAAEPLGGGASAEEGALKTEEVASSDLAALLPAAQQQQQQLEAIMPAAAADSVQLLPEQVAIQQHLLQKAIELLCSASCGYMAGSVLSVMLSRSAPEEVENLKTAYGGKGWLKKMIATEPAIEQIELPSKAEPAYKMAHMLVSFDEPMQDPCAHLRGPQEERGGEQLPDAFSSRDSSSSYLLVDDAQLVASKRAFLQRVKQVIMSSERSCVPGAFITKFLLQEMRDTIEQLKVIYGGKGWLKRLAAEDSSIELVFEDGRGEPCYRVAQRAAMRCRQQPPSRNHRSHGGGQLGRYAAPSQKALLSHGRTGHGHGHGHGHERHLSNLGRQSQQSNRQQTGHGGPGQPAPPLHHAQHHARVHPADEHFEHFVSLLRTETIGALVEEPEGYLTGNSISRRLSQKFPEEVNSIKATFDGKGWLKKLLGPEPSIQQFVAEGKDEPCYKLTS